MFTKQDIREQLTKMGAPQGGIILIHSSLRSVGEVEGGADGLLDTLIDYFTYDGGLFCVPTHTWGNLGTDRITLDMTLYESNLGALALIAAKDPRALRSENPTHSMAVYGNRERALEFIRDDENITTPTSEDSCYGKIYKNGGHILLMGVAQNKNTYLHCVGEMLRLPNRMSQERTKVTVRKPTGDVIEREISLYYTDYTDDISWRFTKYDTAFRYHGCITDGFIGRAPTQLCDAVKMKNTVELIWKMSGGIDPLATERPILPKWYCV